ncbi:hypothetical protein [Acidiphilium multivorum]|uniref:hypothetical protein n=1 Tax=Acidiphilium multivorum TaxID=62140 RepID=UPI001B8D0BB3|nr:hypothetical protein [Acidiphilium multivorum]MBS3025345.1 hypothetical protein [Acidiphilium multivorum]
MPKVMVKPGDGRLVRLPDGRKVPPAGMELEETRLIRKWLRIGDLVKVEEPTATAKSAPAKVQETGK